VPERRIESGFGAALVESYSDSTLMAAAASVLKPNSWRVLQPKGRIEYIAVEIALERRFASCSWTRSSQ
jgi:hypothetical protein